MGVSDCDPAAASNLVLFSTTDLLLYFHTMSVETCFRWLFNKGFFLTTALEHFGTQDVRILDDDDDDDHDYVDDYDSDFG